MSGGLIAGIFLVLFGAAGVWLLRARFPKAYFMQAGYAAMSFGGIISVTSVLIHSVVLGVTGLIVIVVGCISGMIGGSIRKELRIIPPQ